MPDRFSLPLIIDRDGKGEAHVPERLPFGSPPFTEGEYQETLEQHPELLPVQIVDPIFGPLVCIGREVSTGSGPLDNLYVSPNGYITIVETKLWKNPQARRQVVGQIIDYTKHLTRWDYAQLEAAFGEYAKQSGLPERSVFRYVCDQTGEDLDEGEFVDAVQRCLAHGRFLLLVVGDGIREGVEEMASYLQETPNIQFTPALVEIGCYRTEMGGEALLLLVPRIVVKTAEVERAVVRIEMSEEAGKLVEVETKTPKPAPKHRKPTPLTKEEFYDLLGEAIGETKANTVREFVDSLLDEQPILHEHFTTQRLSIRLEFPNVDDRPRTVLSIRCSGVVHTSPSLSKHLRRHGLPTRLAADFYQHIASIHHLLAPETKADGTLTVRKMNYRPVDEVLAHLPTLREAILALAREVEKASEEIGAS